MLCFPYHIKAYTFHIHFFCIIFSFSFIFMPANTFEADTGNNYMYPKVLSLYETVIYICVYPKVLSLYEIVVFICVYPKVSSLYETVTYAMYYVVTLFGATVIQTGSISSTQTGPQYLYLYAAATVSSL